MIGVLVAVAVYFELRLMLWIHSSSTRRTILEDLAPELITLTYKNNFYIGINSVLNIEN